MQITWKKLAGQHRIRELLNGAISKNILSHAYLFAGPPGVGTLQAAVELGMGLLCRDSEITPCYKCDSCFRLLQQNHPDFHYLFPVNLQKEHRGSGDSGRVNEAGWAYISEQARSRIADPYKIIDSGIETLPVEWIRSLTHAIIRGPVQSGSLFAIIDAADLLSSASANALLKTLEEPPANTYIVLLTQRLKTVLPTIRSRCQVVRFGHIEPDDLKKEIICRTGLNPEDPILIRAVDDCQGNLFNALEIAGADVSGTDGDQATRFLQFVTSIPCPGPGEIGEFVELLYASDESGWDRTVAERLMLECMRQLRILFFTQYSGKARTYFCTANQGHDFANRLTPDQAGELLVCCEKAVSGIRAYGNLQLCFVDTILSMMEIVHGKKQ